MQCGCSACNNTGYYGRIGLFEVLDIDEEIKDIIVNNGSSIDIRRKAFGQGYRPLVVDGVKKVLAGITTLNELDRNIVIY